MAIEKGWYEDPRDASRLRYWNGSGWTDKTVSAEVAQQPVAPEGVGATPPFGETIESAGEGGDTETTDATPFETPRSPRYVRVDGPGADSPPRRSLRRSIVGAVAILALLGVVIPFAFSLSGRHEEERVGTRPPTTTPTTTYLSISEQATTIALPKWWEKIGPTLRERTCSDVRESSIETFVESFVERVNTGMGEDAIDPVGVEQFLREKCDIG